jgi:hypothetical protein
MNEPSVKKERIWDDAPEGFACCWKDRRTKQECGKPATLAVRSFRKLMTTEYVLGSRTGLAYCRKHWGQRNAK